MKMTIPNIITLLRLAALPVIIYLFRGNHPVIAAAAVIAAMLTDCLDGWLAEKLNQRSTLGTYLDPVVDKIFLIVLLYEIAACYILPMIIAHLFLARELLQTAVRSTAASRGSVIGANWMGKTKATLQTVLIVCGMILPTVRCQVSDRLFTAFFYTYMTSAWIVLIITWYFFFKFMEMHKDKIFAPDTKAT